MAGERPVVVGVDGSKASQGALRWAAREAARWRRPLRVVHAMSLAAYATEAAVPRLTLADAEAAGRRMLEDAVARARDEAPGTTADGVLELEDSAVHALLRAGDGAEMMVLGSRGRGGVSELLLGSTAHAVARHAPCPLVVVRGDAGQEADDAPVVVGVDGSALSLAAVGFAFAAASARGVGLIAVHAWTRPSVTGSELAAYGLVDPAETERVAQSHALALSETLAGYREQHPDVPVDQRVVEGHPGQVLAAESERASLVVVGSRGRGGFRGLVLGSVSSAALHHCASPVAVVRGNAAAAS